MVRKTFIKQANVALNIPDDVNEFVANNNTIVLCVTGNPYFPNLATKITTLGTNNKLLEETEAAFNSTPQRASKEERDNIYQIVIRNLRAIGRGVQDVADDDIVNAEAIIKSAGLDVRGTGGRTKVYNTAKNGNTEGSVVLKADGPGQHDWRVRTDDTDWAFLDSSRGLIKIVPNLVSGTLYYFQNCKSLPNDEKGEWSPSIKIRIQ